MLSLNVLSIDSASICLISDMVKDVLNSMAVGIWIWRIVAMSLKGNTECLYYLAGHWATPPR